MTAPERRRPLPALAFIGVLCVLTALVWFRVLHRTASAEPAKPACPSRTTSAPRTAGAAAAEKDELPAPSVIPVLVLNSTERTGLAGRAGKQLAKLGFRITDTDNDKPLYGGTGKPIQGVADIRYGPGAKLDATLLHYLFPTATMQPNDSSTAVVTLSLGAKYKAFVPMNQVLTELDRKHITLTTKPIATAAPAAPGC